MLKALGIPFRATNRPSRRVVAPSHAAHTRMPKINEPISPLGKTPPCHELVADVSDVLLHPNFEERFAWEQIQQGSKYYSVPEHRVFEEPTAFSDPIRTRMPDPSLASATAPPNTAPPPGSDADLQGLRDKWMSDCEDMISAIPAELPPLREINHKIPLVQEDMKYRYHRPRCPDALQRLLMEKINRYTCAVWWEAKTTEQAAPLLCIIKKNGKLRTVMDLRLRNDNTVHDLTPMPDQDRIRNDVARAPYRSKLDMSDAYKQIRVDPADVHKTSFSTIYGTFWSHVMQQGDCNASATFQRLMTHIF
jgi:hypothetical protein